MSAKQIVGEWTPWDGSSLTPPLKSETEVVVQFRSGQCGYSDVSDWSWNHDGEQSDIVAYAVIKPYVEPVWRALKGEPFWYVDSFGASHCWTERFDSFCDITYEAGNYYQTEVLATAAAQRVLNAYKGGTP